MLKKSTFMPSLPKFLFIKGCWFYFKYLIDRYRDNSTDFDTKN